MPTKDRILVVDDNPESIWPLVEYLESDYEIIYATTAEKALTLAFSANRPHLILLDIMMPEMDGYQLFAKLKAESYTQDIPIIFITARAEFEDEVKGLEFGAQDYIVKPFSKPVVSARIKSVLNLKKELDRRMMLRTQLEEVNRQLERQVQAKMTELKDAQQALQAYEVKYDYLFKNEPDLPVSRRILVVDDNPDNIHVLVEALEQDYQVLYATSGHKALQMTNGGDRVDLVLLDVMMPEMDGYEVCSRLKASAETWDIPVIFITARNQEVDETKGLNLGAVDFIAKPFSLSVVRARVGAALRLKEEMDSRRFLTRKLEDLNKNLEKRVKEKTVALQQAHDDLLASEKRYRAIYDTAIEGIFEVTPKGRLLSASPSLARILGYPSSRDLMAAVNNVALQLYVDPEDQKRFISALDKKGEVHNFETRFKRKQGDIIWVLICARVVHAGTNSKPHYQGFLVDISQQKASQLNDLQRLRELRLLNKVIAASVNERQAEGILETACTELSRAFHLSQALALLIDKQLTMATVVAEHISSDSESGRAGRSYLNQSVSLKKKTLAAELVTTTSPVAIQSMDDDPRMASFSDLFKAGNIRSLLVASLIVESEPVGSLVMGASELNYFSEDKIRLVQSVTDQISGVLARIQLDEDRRQLERQYFQAQKMEAIGQLTGGVAHDFNNILTVILGLTDVLRVQKVSASQMRTKLDQIYRSGERAADLVRQLLAFSRQQILKPIPLNFNAILKQFESMLHRIIGEDVQMATILDPDLALVKVDQGQMEQVLMNLAVNARDAMPSGGRLTIETANVQLDETYTSQHLDVEPGAYVMVAVSDTGIGIEKSILSQIFEPFFTTKPQGEGTGLGLSTIYGIVKQSGGHIWAYSEPGQGTSFKIYLPKLEKEEKKDPVDEHLGADSNEVGGCETIMVVEDDDALRNMVVDTLSKKGYDVLAADCATTAKDTIDVTSHTIDLLLTDVVIPGDESGVDLAKRLRAIRPLMKVLYMSGYTNNAIVQNGVLDTDTNYIQKPFLTNDLVRKVRQALDAAL